MNLNRMALRVLAGWVCALSLLAGVPFVPAFPLGPFSLGMVSAHAREAVDKKPKLELDQAFREAYAFKKEVEFPNPFLVGPVEPTAVRAALQSTLHRFAKRLVIVAREGSEFGERLLEMPFGQLLLDTAVGDGTEGPIDSGAQVFLSGDAVRDLLAEIYLLVHRLHRERPELNTLELLAALEESADASRPLDPFAVLRPGSRWTVSVDLPPGSAATQSPQLEASILKRMIYRLMGRFRNTHATENSWALDQAFQRGAQFEARFAPKEFQTLAETRLQFQSRAHFPLHFLSLNFASGALQSLAGLGTHADEILDLFIRGKMNYTLLGAGGNPKDPYLISQGLHLLLQFPFLEFESPQMREDFEDEFARFYLELESKPNLTEDVQRELTRAVLGQCEGGAHNRFYRSESRLDELARTVLSKRSSTEFCHFAGLMYYNWHSALGSGLESQAESGTALPPLPESAWVSQEEFLSAWTDQGVLYHGTQDPVSHFRDGLPISHEGHGGIAALGSGFYTTPDMAVTRAFAGEKGFSHPLRVCVRKPGDKSQLRILNWSKMAETPLGLQFSALASRLGRPVQEVLTTLYHLDVCVNTYPLIQSSRVLKIPANPLESLLVFQKKVEQTLISGVAASSSLSSFSASVKQLERLKPLAESLGYPVPDLTNDLEKNFGDPLIQKRIAVYRLLLAKDLRMDYLESQPELMRSLVEEGDPFIWMHLSEVPGIGQSVYFQALLSRAVNLKCVSALKDLLRELKALGPKFQADVLWELRSSEGDDFPLVELAAHFLPAVVSEFFWKVFETDPSNAVAVKNAVRLVGLVGFENLCRDPDGSPYRGSLEERRMLSAIFDAPANFESLSAADPNQRGKPGSEAEFSQLKYSVLKAFFDVGGQVYPGSEEFVFRLFALKDASPLIAEGRLHLLSNYRGAVGTPLLGDQWDLVFEEALRSLSLEDSSKDISSAYYLVIAARGRPVANPGAYAGAVLRLLEGDEKVRDKVEVYRARLGRSFSAARALKLLCHEESPGIQKAIERSVDAYSFGELYNALVQ